MKYNLSLYDTGVPSLGSISRCVHMHVCKECWNPNFDFYILLKFDLVVTVLTITYILTKKIISYIHKKLKLLTENTPQLVWNLVCFKWRDCLQH